MGNKISLPLKSDGIKKTVHFQFSPELYLKGELKSTSIRTTFSVEEHEIGILEMSFEDFDNFCLDLFNEHKKIMENQ
jgi:hypothetical protein